MQDPRSVPVRIGPTEDEKRLAIEWRDGHRSEYKPRYLRLRCRCAGCIDERTGQRILESANVPPDVFPVEIRYVGRYALGFDWSDGHSTGIFPFELLREICPCAECVRQRP